MMDFFQASTLTLALLGAASHHSLRSFLSDRSSFLLPVLALAESINVNHKEQKK